MGPHLPHEARLPAIWAGVECTVNRIHDDYCDQILKSGHITRPSDIELFAELGIERIRYPFLWEHATPDGGTDYDWTWADERLALLQRASLTPIAGFLHHGSGPRDTSLVDPEFPRKFAAYARAFAERYPWVTDYTPINEPLTTARFSCLYRVWYPHLQDDRAFARAVYNQIRATVLAMRAIREQNPGARLIQTDDLGRASSTPELAEQVRFENERRWLSFDLLHGRVNRDHFMYAYLTSSGVSPTELAWLEDNACPPDIIGINHYHLSNRFLDHRVELYPAGLCTGNGVDVYADVGAVDTGQVDPPTPKSILREVWDRYRSPVAVTEVHTHGHRESQLRWLEEIWTAAVELREEGVDIAAITAWSLLGSFDWNSLCTRIGGCGEFYESGVFDLRAPQPRPTALARMVRALASEGRYDHPVLAQPGWWRQPIRVRFAHADPPPSVIAGPRAEVRPVIITGATSALARAFARACETRDLPYRLLNRQDLDIASPESVVAALETYRPWAIINAAGFNDVDLAEIERERCYRENVVGPETLASVCARNGVRLLSFSSDLVFDGANSESYSDSHTVAPLNVYGNSKVEGERRVLNIFPEALIVRTGPLFGAGDASSFVARTLTGLVEGALVHAAGDVEISPTYVPDLTNACLDLLIDGERGLLHLANDGRTTWLGLARRAAELWSSVANDDQRAVDAPYRIAESKIEDLALRARLPLNTSLVSERVRIMPPLEDALRRYFFDDAKFR